MIPHAAPMTPIPANITTVARIFPASGYGIDIAIPHRRQSDNRPPQAIEHRAEDHGLSRVLKVVHAQAGRNDEYRGACEQRPGLIPRETEGPCEPGRGSAVRGELCR